MTSNKFECLRRVKAVEREHSALCYAADYLLDIVRQDPIILGRVLRVRDIQDAAGRLEGTYIIRLFAEFETGLRAFWRASRGPRSPSRTRDLLDSVGAKRKVPDDAIMHAHSVREFRNALIHERDDDVAPVPIAIARHNLCVFLGFLPTQW